MWSNFTVCKKQLAEKNRHLPDGRRFPSSINGAGQKKNNIDRVQLCAQAMCLEEMLAVAVPKGALFYGKTRRRVDVALDEVLRQETASAARKLHELFASRRTPPPVYASKCDRCSFLETCLPKTLHGRKSSVRYLKSLIELP
jgi:CRISPR-associated exonuclease Cas4